ncbi:Transmembrane amino acid transporter protein [Histomonas meleagridis]|uniref:Transmembrane amino acid transporter protein n=1 Tax=Histomonas meleagridis TaxID=135588 RepID=UPI0035597A20|nr:Transmembrane amino acid transporter protein [Histomonas meleagridis]KAH0807013.1 Transmembrane amino acid transporter protein [Histomonas meleagridis]
MNLINSLMGAGILSVSNSFTFSGFYPSFILLTLVAVLSYFSACIVARLQIETGAESFADLAHKTTGKIGSGVLSVCVVLFCYSTMVAYLIIGCNVITDFFALGGIKIPDGWGRPVLVLTFCICVPIAMTFPRRLTMLSMISTSAFFCLIFFFVSIIIKACQFFPKNGICPTCENGLFSMGLFNALAIYSLSFAMSVILLPILMQSDPNLKKRYFSIGATFFICYLFVMVPGVIGYLMFGKETKEVILDSFPQKDVLMIIVKAGYFVVLTASYPAIGLTAMATYSRVFFKEDEAQKLPWGKRAVCLLTENLPPLLITLFIPNVRPALAIGGALGGCMTNFFFPAIFTIILSPNRWFSWKNIPMVLLAAFGIIATVISTYEGVLDAIRSFSKKQ